ncbi:MAG TPA: UDP-N-acetylmuramate dehydrogenase [Bryobacteraceae bacterium]
MPVTQEAFSRLGQIPNLQVSEGALLARYTRFGIGGPADIYAETGSVESFVAALEAARTSGLPWVVIGGGTNLVVADAGFRGIVLRFTAASLQADGNRVTADAGAELQSVVDYSVGRGLGGLETLAGIPGSLGAAVYGNAGAYGHSISEVVESVRFFDGRAVRAAANPECEFHYRESVFKRHKDWIVFSAVLALAPGDAAEMAGTASGIVATRNRKFPPAMKCAGSVFKNLILAELPGPVAVQVPERVVREGKVPAAYFLEQAGAKGLSRGDIHVAEYHANLIYNAGAGAADDLVALIADLKRRVRARFGFELEEEVQYVGFER